MAKLIVELQEGREEPMYIEREITSDRDGTLGREVYFLLAERPRNMAELDALAQLYAFETGAVPSLTMLQNPEQLGFGKYGVSADEVSREWGSLPLNHFREAGLDVIVRKTMLHVDSGFAGSDEYVRNNVELLEFTCQEKLDSVKRYREWQKGRMD